MTTVNVNLDVRTTLPKGANTVDMQPNGNRSGPVSNYGPPTLTTVLNILKAWNVKERYSLDGYLDELKTKLRIVHPSNDSGPRFMILCDDNRWRYASFRGINGPPWIHCPFESFEAPNGHIAYLMLRKRGQQAHLEHLQAKVSDCLNEIGEIDNELEEALKKCKGK